MSTHKRFFIESLNYPEDTVAVLEGEEFIHAKAVLRVEEGSEIILLDGSGNEYSAIVVKVEKHRLSAHITGVTEGDKEPKQQIYLLCGALKGDKTELIVQKACELGVSKIGVFSSEYCSAYMSDNKLERLKKVAREAIRAVGYDFGGFAFDKCDIIEKIHGQSPDIALGVDSSLENKKAER